MELNIGNNLYLISPFPFNNSNIHQILFTYVKTGKTQT